MYLNYFDFVHFFSSSSPDRLKHLNDGNASIIQNETLDCNNYKCLSRLKFSFIFSSFIFYWFHLLYRTESKRIYKTLLRTHHKSNAVSESQVNKFNGTEEKNPQLFITQPLTRWTSTPSLKRCWLCQSCKVLNNSVTWHCLNCDCVSFIAPIYKDTLQKGRIRSEENISAIETNSNLISNANANVKCKTKLSISNSISCGKLSRGAGVMNQSTSINNFDVSSNRYGHRVTQHRRDDFCSHAATAGSIPSSSSTTTTTTGDCYVKQMKFNEVTRYRPADSLCQLNRHIENKSLPNIVDAFKTASNGMNGHGHGCGRGGGTELSEHFFGERIFMVNKPNAFTSLLPSDNMHCHMNSTPMRKASTPTHEIQQFTRFATKSAARESVVKKMCTPGEACRMCNLNRCPNNGLLPMNGKHSSDNNSINTSRFTITTLSRHCSIRDNDKNQTLSRNGGVLIAVRDWSMNNKPNEIKNDSTNTQLSPDSYYEILRNPNNNNTVTDSNGENDRTPKTQTHIYQNSAIAKTENNGPIYAVVNRMNKTKNAQSQQQQLQNTSRSPVNETTKFTYIGISPSNNVKEAKLANETDSLYASIKGTQFSSNLSNNNNVAINDAITNSNSLNNNAISDCITTPTTINADFSTKVWKGAKKPMDKK